MLTWAESILARLTWAGLHLSRRYLAQQYLAQHLADRKHRPTGTETSDQKGLWSDGPSRSGESGRSPALSLNAQLEEGGTRTSSQYYPD
jgi:hypothetical protein